MKINEAAEVLKSSVLEPLFTDLDKVEVEEKENLTVCRVEIKNPSDDTSPFTLLLLEDDTTQVLRILGVAQTKEMHLVARVAHVNHINTIGKLCWDPENGEVYVEIAALKQSESGMSPSNFETMAANAMAIFFNERAWFMKSEIEKLVEKKLVSRDQAQALMNSVVEPIKNEINPRLQQAM
ncbi:MAG: hypothetical protein JJU29_01760 [Verrucomicrobia bacterium]|nr:hypothetical protein [Verrucomicrobiota bacterium]MCH8510959.1 hypothetical protein [Kiritimatiellia bacterium]